MIELLPNMPAGVTGVRVSGRLSGDELRGVEPVIEDMLDTDEITVHAMAWMLPGELKTFRLDELDAAKEWAAG